MIRINNRHKHSKITKRTIRLRFKNLYKTLKNEKITSKYNAKEITTRLIRLFTKNIDQYEKINGVYYKTEEAYELFKGIIKHSNKKYGRLISYSDDISTSRKNISISTESWFIVVDDDNNIIIYFAK